jgi:hypothetical protein
MMICLTLSYSGDCDSDRDCLGTLVCFRRGPNTPVPGCAGGAADRTGSDYCVLSDPNAPVPAPSPGGSEPALRIVGNNGSPRSAFPLGLCEGVCTLLSFPHQ